MTSDGKVLAFAALAAGAWWWWQRQNATPNAPRFYPSAPAGVPRSRFLSNVTPSPYTSSAATNVANVQAQITDRVYGRLNVTAPGNAPVLKPANFAGVVPGRTYGQPATGYTTLAIPDKSLALAVPFWMVDPNFANPMPTNIAGLAWTTTPSVNLLIPPTEQ